MHKSFKTTDEIYSRLVDDDVASNIANLGRGSTSKEELLNEELLNEKLLNELAELLFQRKIEVTQDKGT